MTGKVRPPLEKKKKEEGELPAGWAAEGPEAPHGALDHLPKLPRTLMLGGDLNGSCAKRRQRCLEVNPRRRQREGDPAPTRSWQVPDFTEQESEAHEVRDLTGHSAPGGRSRPEPRRPPLPSFRHPKLWATPPSGASLEHSPSEGYSSGLRSVASPSPLSMALADILEAVREHQVQSQGHHYLSEKQSMKIGSVLPDL